MEQIFHRKIRIMENIHFFIGSGKIIWKNLMAIGLVSVNIESSGHCKIMKIQK